MVDNRYRHAGIHLAGPDAGFGRMLLISLGIHLLAAVLFAVGLRPPPRPAPPAYRVDLVSLPVAHPRAGSAAAPAPIAPVVSRPPTSSAPRQLPAKTTPKTTVPSKTPKPAEKTAIGKKPAKGPAPSSIDDDYDEVQANLKIMQMRRERDRRRQVAEAKINQALAVERQQHSTATGSSSSKSGDQLGSAYEDWIKVQLHELWTLSRYQVGGRRDLSCELELRFDARGTLADYRIERRSGDERFDDSVRRAVLQLKQLPSAPGKNLSLTVEFNLKDLLEP